ncbi:SusC/RagA family TonB-linked outer membrane protein [Halalkalibaculum sp. DA3122]|uniref:SusC/RagA family TonB-linked outer membrane protein n=1 Tax=Halalkalibaculum sp. DA3122 TaxID=3373607 RepID=UPI0037542036
MKRLLLIFGIMLWSYSQLWGQTVSGQITDQSNGDPLPGVNVVVKNSTTGTATNSEGNYELEVRSLQDTLVVSFVGFERKEIPIDGRTTINIQLVPRVYEGDELVVSGYQVQRKVDVTGAVSIAETEDFENSPTSNPIKSLQGSVPGLFINTNGDPAGGAEVRVRGVSTLNNNDPLYVIDGVPTKQSAFDILNPNDIESIQVLKDAASASIYGARASNGVIVVTTKQAEENAFQVDYSSKFTHSAYTTKPSMLDTKGRARVQWQATVNDGGDPDEIPIVEYDWERKSDGTAVLNSITIPEYITEGVPTANTDWFEAMTRDGFIQEHNLSVSTGGERGGAVLSLRYYKDEYIMKFNNYEKVSARINSHHNFLDGDIKIGENLTISNGVDNGYGGVPFANAWQIRPMLPVRTEDGSYSGPVTGDFVDQENPVMLLDYNQWDKTGSVNMFGNVYADISLLENLTMSNSFGIDWINSHSRDIQRTFNTGFISRETNSLENFKSESFNWNLSSTLQYDLQLNNHNTTFLAGVEATRNQYSNNFSYREDFAVETENYMVENAGSGRQSVGGSRTGSALLSYFGKINYVFNNKYLASATFRYDGSSRFGSNNRYGTFPSLSAGWRLGNESFISNNLQVISELKFRASWGVTGNQEISDIARYTIYRTHYGEDAVAFNSSNGTAYDLNGADSGPLPSGFRKTQTGNSNLKWEETEEFNLGLDFGLFEDKLTGSIDVFERNTEDILISPDYIAVRGEGGNRFVNGASVETTGAEFFIEYRNQAGEFNYSIRGNVGHYKDKITELPADVVDSYPGNSEKTILGQSMNSHFGYVYDGIFQNQQEVDEHADQTGKGVGRIRYKDLNGDGVITPLDQKYLGTSTADYEYGLNLQASYKKFDVRVFLQGVLGREVYNQFKRRTDFASLWAGTNYGTRMLDAWTPSNRDTFIPAATLTDSNNEGRVSTYFIDNGSYLKLRQISLGYTPNNFLGTRSIRLFVTGENLLTVKDNSGIDAFTAPDPEDPSIGLPRPRKVSVGINLSF